MRTALVPTVNMSYFVILQKVDNVLVAQTICFLELDLVNFLIEIH